MTADIFPDLYHIFHDAVGVFADTGQVFRDARPTKVVIKENASIMTHPLENDALVSDHILHDPVDVEMDLICPTRIFRDIYSEIRALYYNAAVLSVRTRTGCYRNLIIYAITPTEDTARLDASEVKLKLKQVKRARTEDVDAAYDPADPSQTSTVQKGEVQGKVESVIGFGSGGWI